MFSGIALSRHLFTFVSLDVNYSWARTIHSLSAYWGYIIMAWHLGLHWAMILNMFRNIFRKKQMLNINPAIVQAIGFFIAIYGVYAFFSRRIGTHLFFVNEYTFFDYSEPIAYFFIDYTAIMGLFVFTGYYFLKIIKVYKAGKGSLMQKNRRN